MLNKTLKIFSDLTEIGLAIEKKQSSTQISLSGTDSSLNLILDNQNITELKSFFTSSKATFFVYNLKEFSKELLNLEIELPAKIYDIQLGSYVQNSNDKNDFEEVVKRELNIEFKEDSGDQESLMEEDNSEFQNLVLKAKLSLEIGQKYQKNILEPQLNLWQNIESPLAPILGKMENFGVYIDKQKLEEISAELKQKSIEFEAAILKKLNLPDLNINSTKQLPEALINAGFDLKKANSRGKISTDKETLDNLKKDDKTGVILEILEYRTVSKLYSTYTESFLGQLDENSRIHGVYSQAQVPTGRLSSNSPNLQNIPIKNPVYGPMIRSTFSSPKGSVLVGSDYSQFELRLLAHFCKDPVLIETFKLGQDVHTRTAAEVFEIPIEKVSKEQRRLGKTLNFALLYQQGAYSTAIQLGIEQKEAKAFIERYFAKFAKVKPFIDQTLENAKKDGFVETIFGRRRYFKNLNSKIAILRKVDERAAFNALLQGSNADIIKVAMVSLDKKLKREKLNAQIILQVHDELVLECAQKDAQRVKEILISEMEANQPLNVPIEVNAGIGKNWNELK